MEQSPIQSVDCRWKMLFNYLILRHYCAHVLMCHSSYISKDNSAGIFFKKTNKQYNFSFEIANLNTHAVWMHYFTAVQC